ncbi:MAG: cysteine desulfurase [Lachnospiraceae bacterium]|nr:cysteine desulfurase [Lachnospiraceae bacterium]MCR4802956.1 cysteine desulfurase [Lachnospiraceae bacterium]
MEAYLDNAATTCPFPQVRDIMMETMENEYGNPSSLHMKGVNAEQYVKQARKVIAKALKVTEKEIIFTSGGTESNNQALIGAAMANHRKGKHIITTKIEHASVHNPLLFLESQGYKISFVSVDKNGHVDMDELLQLMDDETSIVSIMHVNNEIGAVEDIEAIGKAIKEKDASVLFHVDAIQSFGKFKISPKKCNIDLMSVSGHKIHGPKGIGFLYIKDKTKINPYIYGGGQQKGMRSGTENVPGIAGLGKAVELIHENHEEKINKLYELKQYFVEQVEMLPDVHVNGCTDMDIRQTAPHVVSVTTKGVRSEVLLHALEDKGIYVSSGSACSSNHPALSGTLQAIGLPKDEVESTIRFSFSVFTTKEELDYAIEAMKELLPVLRKYVRR